MKTLRSVLFRLGYFPSWLLTVSLVGVLWWLDWQFHMIGTIPQYDKLLHFGAGFACGIFGVRLLSYAPFNWIFAFARFERALLISAIAWALIIGGAWEVWEYLTPWTRNYGPWDSWDTFFDLVFDCLGATLAAGAYQKGS